MYFINFPAPGVPRMCLRGILSVPGSPARDLAQSNLGALSLYCCLMFYRLSQIAGEGNLGIVVCALHLVIDLYCKFHLASTWRRKKIR